MMFINWLNSSVSFRYPAPFDDLLHMLPSNQSLNMTRNVLNEQLDKRIAEIKQERYWDWQATEDSGKI